MLIAHRGGVGNTNIQENSLQAFSRAMLMFPRIGGIEFDVRKTKDNILIVAHDPTVIMNGKHEYIDTLTYSNIKGRYNYDDDINNHLCTLTEVLDLAKSQNYKGELNIEIKDYDVTELLNSTIDKPEYRDLIFFITSFLHSEINKFNLLEKEVNSKLGYLFASYPYNMKDVLSLTYSYLNTTYPMKIVLNDKSLPRCMNHPQMQELLNHAENISVYTVNMAEDIKYYQECGFSVITDFI